MSRPVFLKHVLLLVILPFTIWSGESKLFAQNALIALDGVRIFSLPMVDESPVAILSKGDTVRVIGQRGEWVKVEMTSGKKGWMLLQVQRAETTSKRPEVTPWSGTNGRSAPDIDDQNGLGMLPVSRNGDHLAARNATNDLAPDVDTMKSRTGSTAQEKSLFGYAFGMGLLEGDFIYDWKFVYYTKPGLAMVGSFKHALGEAADSYFIMVNWDYHLKENGSFLPYLSAGMGVINTVPERSIELGGVSNMTINYGFGALKRLRKNMTLRINASVYTVFIGKGAHHFKELAIGFMVGEFWQ